MMEENKIIKKIKSILPIGFNIQITSDRTILGVKSHNNIHHILNIGDLSEQKINNLTAIINMTEVEDIISPNRTNEIYRTTIKLESHGKVFNYVPREEMLKFFPISLKSDLENACDLIKTFIHKDALPFFEYWSDIRDFLPFIETEDSLFINDFLGGYGVFQKFVIWHLTSHPKRKKLQDELINSYEIYLKENPTDNLSKRDFELLKRIVEKLIDISPKYEWDKRYLEKKSYR